MPSEAPRTVHIQDSNHKAPGVPKAKWPRVDRRVIDRRSGPTSLWSTIFGPARRCGGRRHKESANIYVDVYRSREVAIVVLILLLNVLDAYFTLDYLGKGGKEANPVADQLLNWGDTYFIYAKSLLVAICLLFLLVHKTFQFVRPALWFLFVFYGVLFVYHMYLQITHALTT